MKDIFDYNVYDKNGSKVGSVENLWSDETNAISFIGVRTGWLGMGDNHLLPAEGITVDDSSRCIHVPYDEDLIKRSPSFESDRDLSDEVETGIHAHYGTTPTYGAARGAAAPPAQPAANYGNQADVRRAEGEAAEIPLAKETLHIEKRQKGAGEVRLRKVVRSETVNQPVELRHEEVVVERVPGGKAKPGEDAFTEKVATIPVRDEEAVVTKSVESAGTVKARKEVETERKDVRGTVRREDVKVEHPETAGRPRR